MGKLSNISGKQAVKAFKKADWKPVGQVGSHLVMIKPGMLEGITNYPKNTRFDSLVCSNSQAPTAGS